MPEAMQEVIGCIPSGKTFIISTIPDQERKYQITVLTNHLIHIGNPSWQPVAYLSLLGTRARDGKGWQVGVVPSRSCCHRAANRRRPKLSICHKVHTRPGRPDLARPDQSQASNPNHSEKGDGAEEIIWFISSWFHQGKAARKKPRPVRLRYRNDFPSKKPWADYARLRV